MEGRELGVVNTCLGVRFLPPIGSICKEQISDSSTTHCERQLYSTMPPTADGATGTTRTSYAQDILLACYYQGRLETFRYTQCTGFVSNKTDLHSVKTGGTLGVLHRYAVQRVPAPICKLRYTSSAPCETVKRPRFWRSWKLQFRHQRR